MIAFRLGTNIPKNKANPVAMLTAAVELLKYIKLDRHAEVKYVTKSLLNEY